MRTDAIVQPSAAVAVPTEHPIARQFRLLRKPESKLPMATMFLAIFRAVSIDMIDCEKRGFRLATTSANRAVNFAKLRINLSAPRAGLGNKPLTMRRVVLSKIFRPVLTALLASLPPTDILALSLFLFRMGPQVLTAVGIMAFKTPIAPLRKLIRRFLRSAFWTTLDWFHAIYLT
jgi:hypothetical protein